MKCKACKREIPEESIFCLHCGERVVKVRAKKKQELSVPKPKQLADGRWSGQVMVNGKRLTVYGSTVKEYEAAARAMKLGVIEMKLKMEKPVGEAIDDYLAANSNLLSMSTMRSFSSYRKFRFQDCMSWNIYDTDNDWQKAINDELTEVGNKTVRNAWGLITATMTYHKVPHPTVKLPRKKKVERPWLDYKQIDVFVEAIKGEEFELAALMALHSMRLSELIAVKPEHIDLKKGEIKIRGARVIDKEMNVVYKDINKTDASWREIPIVIPRLTELLTPEVMRQEWVADYSEKRLYDKVNAVCAKHDLPKVGVHGLRHSFASLAYHLGWQKMSTQAVGGWSNSKIVDEIYTHNADLDRDIKKMKKYYSKKQKA
jgi:integrase